MVIHSVEYRYGSDEMRRIFTRENWMELAKNIEYSLLRALKNSGLINISDEDLKKIYEKFKTVTYEDLIKHERVTRHEVMALVKALAEVSGEYGGYIHLGLTSNDVLDNVLMLQINDALKIIVDKLSNLLNRLKELIENEKRTPILARTHGRVAIPITYGFKFSLFLDELYRIYRRLYEDFKYIGGKIGGAVGSQVELYPHMEKIEEYILTDLKLKRVSFYTQVIPRDRLAYIFTDLSILSSILDQFANEIRNLQRSEIDEVCEGFETYQVGSSVMPHKKNPVKSERICGLAKVVRSYAIGFMENIVLEHERDLTNSSFERTVIPEIFLLVDEQLNTLSDILKHITIMRENALRNLKRFTPEIYSDLLVQVGTLNGGDRQIIHEKLRQLFVSKKVSSVEELISEIRKDAYLREYLPSDKVLEALSLNRYIKAAEYQVNKFLKSVF